MSNDATPERGVAWLLAVEVARGRMPGEWVPVDAGVVLAVNARLAALENWCEGHCTCPCCESMHECLPGCTFAEDCPEEYQRMAGARAALFGASI